jgi:hypothetical protein
MKTPNLFALLVPALFALAAAPARADTLTGASKYTADWCPTGQDCGRRPSFSDLEQLGVRKAAEDNAVSSCFAAGYAACYPTSSQITSCNGTEFSGGILRITCEASATAIGFRNP